MGKDDRTRSISNNSLALSTEAFLKLSKESIRRSFALSGGSQAVINMGGHFLVGLADRAVENPIKVISGAVVELDFVLHFRCGAIAAAEGPGFHLHLADYLSVHPGLT